MIFLSLTSNSACCRAEPPGNTRSFNKSREPAAHAATQKLLRGPRNTTWSSGAKKVYKNQKKLLKCLLQLKDTELTEDKPESIDVPARTTHRRKN